MTNRCSGALTVLDIHSKYIHAAADYVMVLLPHYFVKASPMRNSFAEFKTNQMTSKHKHSKSKFSFVCNPWMLPA